MKIVKQIWHWIRSEWEQSLFGCSVLLILIFCLLWVLGFRAKSGPGGRWRGMPECRSVFSDTAFSFLDSAAAPRLQGDNPFEFVMAVEGMRPAIRPPAAKPEEKPQPKPKPRPKPQVIPKPPEKEPEPVEPVVVEKKPVEPQVPRPKRVLGYRIVKYVYSSTNRSGVRVALIQVADPTAKSVKPHTLAVGDYVDGMRLSGFESNAVVMQDARGKKVRIPFGDSRKLVGVRIIEQ